MTLTAPHTGIHPTLSALVQISTTFCIDALCSSNIALNSSSRALAMGAIYLAVRTVGLELPMPFQDWCYAWGSLNISAGFGIQTSGSSLGSGGLISPGIASGSGSIVSGTNGILGLSSSGSNSLFVAIPRSTTTTISNTTNNDSTAVSNGFAGGTIVSGTNGVSSKDSVYGSQSLSPLLSNNDSPSAPLGSPSSMQEPQQQQLQQQPLTIVDE
ncbi:hypothetical protein BGZ65_007560, partial [Modicella reniformis]